MRAMFLTAIAALTLASAAEQSGIAEMHRQKLHAAMERYITYEGWAFGAQPNGWFAAVAEKYAQTNQLSFDGIVLLVQEKLEKEYDAFRNGTPLPDDGTGGDRKARVGMSINMLESLGRNPISLPFLYRMSREAEGHYRKMFEDMYNETLEKSPVWAMRQEIDDPERGQSVDLLEMWKIACGRMAVAFRDENHVFEGTGERVDELVPFVLDYLPRIEDQTELLRLEYKLVQFWPEYRTSLQRDEVWQKIKNLEPSYDWEASTLEKIRDDFKSAPKGTRSDLRRAYDTLPPPVVPSTASQEP